MTNEEALNRLKWKYSLTKDYNDPHWEGGERREHSEWVEQLEIAIKALEKQIPKKVNISLKGTTDWNTKCRCPNCYSMVSHGKYCSNCGQALDFNNNGSDTE